MNKIDSTQLLAQLRAASIQARASQQADTPPVNGANFSSLLSQSIDKVNSMQQTAQGLQSGFEMGDPKVSLAQMMIASNKAGLAFEGMVQVRNRMVEAYQEIMRMQV